MMRRSLALILPMMAVLVIILVPSSAAADVNIMEVGIYEGSIGASESITFQWVMYNNDSSSYLVKVLPTIMPDSHEVTAIAVEDFKVLNPGDDWVVAVTLSASRGAPTGQVDMEVIFEMEDMATRQIVNEKREASVKVTALFEREGSRIFAWENTLPAPFNGVWSTFFIVLLVWTAAATLVHFTLFPLAKRIARRSRFELWGRLLRTLRMPTLLIIVTYGLIDSLDILNVSPDTHIALWQLYEIIVILLLAWTTYRIFNDIVMDFAERWAIKTESGLDDVLVPILQKVGMLIIPLFAAGAALAVIGVDLTLAVASMGVVGLVIGLAAQHSLGNLFSGLLLMLDRPFRIGDLVKLDTGEICRVRRIGLRTTQLYNTFEHTIIVLPNDILANGKVENWSRPDNRHSQGTEVRVAYGTDLERVHELLLQVADEHPDVIKEPGQMPYVRTAQLGETAVDFKLWYWVDVGNMWKVASDMRMAVERKLREEGIEIPFPQAVVSLNAPLSPTNQAYREDSPGGPDGRTDDE